MLRNIALWLGISMTAIGLLGIGAYLLGVADIVINRPADRSWLFWGLSLASIGATVLLGGVGLLILWRHLEKPDA